MSETPTTSIRGQVSRYLDGLSPRQHLALAAEDWLGWLVRSMPGALGFGLRYLLARLVFARLDGPCFIYPAARLMHGYGIRAGSNMRINTGVFIDARGGLEVGNDVLFGPNVVIVTSQHHWSDPRLPIVAQGHRSAPVRIGDDVWIGGNAVIAQGVNLATGTVVGAGAVVTADTEPYAIVAGVPARPIGSRAVAAAADESAPAGSISPGSTSSDPTSPETTSTKASSPEVPSPGVTSPESTPSKG